MSLRTNYQNGERFNGSDINTTNSEVNNINSKLPQGITSQNPIIVKNNLNDYSTKSWVEGKGYLTDAPSDGKQYARKDGSWAEVEDAGVSDYEDILNKPKINGNELVGNKTTEDLGIEIPSKTSELSNDSGYQTGDDVDTKISYHNRSTSAHSDIRSIIPSVVDNVTSTATNKALSAKQGKYLNDRINNLQPIGRFLSLWNCVTGMPATNPSGYPYRYKTGDYFRINKVADEEGQKNYMPVGDTYEGVASTTEYIGDVKTDDVWFYDGSVWSLQDSRSGGDGVQDVKVDGESVVSEGIAVISLPTSLDELTDDENHRLVTDQEKTAWSNKQNAISDLSTIRSGATAGSTAVQPSDISDMASKTWVNGLGFRRIFCSTSEPTSTDGSNGDIWFVYE